MSETDPLIIHLKNGTTLIARILGEDEQGRTVLEYAHEVHGVPQPDGRTGVAMVPYLSLHRVLPSMVQIPVPEDMIHLVRPAPDNLVASFVQKTSGIVVPPKSSIITG